MPHHESPGTLASSHHHRTVPGPGRLVLRVAPYGGPSDCVCPTCPAWSGRNGRSDAVGAAPPPALPAGPWGQRGCQEPGPVGP